MPGKSGPHARDKVCVSLWMDYRDARRLLQIARRAGVTRTDILARLAIAVIEGEARQKGRSKPSRRDVA